MGGGGGAGAPHCEGCRGELWSLGVSPARHLQRAACDAGCLCDARAASVPCGTPAWMAAQAEVHCCPAACRVKKAEKERLKGIEELEKKEKKEKKKKEKEEKR